MDCLPLSSDVRMRLDNVGAAHGDGGDCGDGGGGATFYCYEFLALRHLDQEVEEDRGGEAGARLLAGFQSLQKEEKEWYLALFLQVGLVYTRGTISGWFLLLGSFCLSYQLVYIVIKSYNFVPEEMPRQAEVLRQVRQRCQREGIFSSVATSALVQAMSSPRRNRQPYDLAISLPVALRLHRAPPGQRLPTAAAATVRGRNDDGEEGMTDRLAVISHRLINALARRTLLLSCPPACFDVAPTCSFCR